MEPPGEYGLRRRHASLGGDRLYGWIAQGLALGQRTIGRDDDIARLAPGARLTLLQEGMDFDLIDHRGDARVVHQLLEMADHEIADPDRPNATLVVKPLKRPPGPLAQPRH